MFAHLGSRVLFAGDPKQLAPIAQSDDANVVTWLAASPFEWAERTAIKSATVLLDEQFRMAKPISDAVSQLFYRSALRVAEPFEKDPSWNSDRTAIATKLLSNEYIVLVDTQAAAQPAHTFRGCCCPESAIQVVAIVLDYVMNWQLDPRADILILTPYRAQRRAIESELNSANISGSIVSTVHRAQGSEKNDCYLRSSMPNY